MEINRPTPENAHRAEKSTTVRVVTHKKPRKEKRENAHNFVRSNRTPQGIFGNGLHKRASGGTKTKSFLFKFSVTVLLRQAMQELWICPVLRVCWSLGFFLVKQ